MSDETTTSAPLQEVTAVATRDTTAVPNYASMLDLNGRGMVVAGAGQGIGRQVSHALAQAGARVMCIDYDMDAAEHVASEIGGGPFKADVRERSDLEQALKTAESEFGRVAGIVDIVGMAKYRSLLDHTEEDYEWTFQMVLQHAWHLTRLGGAMMAEHGGAMTYIASVSGIFSAPWHSAYGAAKAGLMSLVRTSAVEFGPSGVRVNAVAPGFVWTPRIAAMLGEEGKAKNDQTPPLKRVAEPSDIASAVLYLQSDLAAYVTGQTLIVDGGVSVKFPYNL